VSNWSLYEEDDLNWEVEVSYLKTATYLHDNSWANHLENLGWIVCRWKYQSNKKNIAFLQGFLKRYPFGVGVLWFPEWIIGSYELSYEVIETIKKSLSLRFLTIRIRSNRPTNDDELKFLKLAFTPASKPFGSSLTMHLDLSLTTDELFNNLSKNWRRNLKRSKKLEYEIVEVQDANIISKLYCNMSEAKGLSKVFFSKQQIESLMNSHASRVLVIGAKTPNGVIQTIRGVIIRDNQAIDIFAATNAFSRKHYLSYGVCWDLLNRCKTKGCTHFDFSGVDPENNKGVYNFKKGTGSKLVENLGEFEYSNSFIMKNLVAFASRWRS
tara:strand:- start:3716 stop:4690 length:975 start_codon:yes stop_codon:yes gene_type:complete